MTYDEVKKYLSEEVIEAIDEELQVAYDYGWSDGRREGYWEGEESVDCDEEDE